MMISDDDDEDRSLSTSSIGRRLNSSSMNSGRIPLLHGNDDDVNDNDSDGTWSLLLATEETNTTTALSSPSSSLSSSSLSLSFRSPQPTDIETACCDGRTTTDSSKSAAVSYHHRRRDSSQRSQQLSPVEVVVSLVASVAFVAFYAGLCYIAAINYYVLNNNDEYWRRQQQQQQYSSKNSIGGGGVEYIGFSDGNNATTSTNSSSSEYNVIENDALPIVDHGHRRPKTHDSSRKHEESLVLSKRNLEERVVSSRASKVAATPAIAYGKSGTKKCKLNRPCKTNTGTAGVCLMNGYCDHRKQQPTTTEVRVAGKVVHNQGSSSKQPLDSRKQKHHSPSRCQLRPC